MRMSVKRENECEYEQKNQSYQLRYSSVSRIELKSENENECDIEQKNQS
jgi:hypothetical protein